MYFFSTVTIPATIVNKPQPLRASYVARAVEERNGVLHTRAPARVVDTHGNLGPVVTHVPRDNGAGTPASMALVMNEWRIQ